VLSLMLPKRAEAKGTTLKISRATRPVLRPLFELDQCAWPPSA